MQAVAALAPVSQEKCLTRYRINDERDGRKKIGKTRKIPQQKSVAKMFIYEVLPSRRKTQGRVSTKIFRENVTTESSKEISRILRERAEFKFPPEETNFSLLAGKVSAQEGRRDRRRAPLRFPQASCSFPSRSFFVSEVPCATTTRRGTYRTEAFTIRSSFHQKGGETLNVFSQKFTRAGNVMVRLHVVEHLDPQPAATNCRVRPAWTA